MAYKVTSTAILGEGASRYVDVTPELRAKFDEYVSAGKANVTSSNSGSPAIDENGNRVITVVTIWNSKADHDEYSAWLEQNHGVLRREYILSMKGKLNHSTVGEEI